MATSNYMVSPAAPDYKQSSIDGTVVGNGSGNGKHRGGEDEELNRYVTDDHPRVQMSGSAKPRGDGLIVSATAMTGTFIDTVIGRTASEEE
jgi:hypothetical protein